MNNHMITKWTKEEIENVLLQLNDRNYPFKKYRFSRDESGMVMLGSGGCSNVYEMENINDPAKKYAVKILGFGERPVDTEEFIESVLVQQLLGANNVVDIIKYQELRVYLDESYQVDKVFNFFQDDEEDIQSDYISLQFILMEKLVPVLTMDKAGKPKLYPQSLADFDESEIMQLAYDIGTALESAHKKNILHRDIKLENVFYDSKKKKYKLGDFGIAKKTETGMASTVAFTKGYGAPEVVGSMDERYDNTADIYSFGIMLYLLLNELKFPDSENYNVNVAMQYSKGYQFPLPEHKEYKLCSVLGMMCQYDPDERYQSMEDVLNAMEGILHGASIRFKKENIKTFYTAGFVCYVAGMILWKLAHMPELTMDIGICGYLFIIVCGCKYWLGLKNKENGIFSRWVLGLGIVVLISTGFTWWKIVLILGATIFEKSISGLVSIGMFIVTVLSKIMLKYPQIYDTMQSYKWVGIVFLSFSVVLLWYYLGLSLRTVKINKMYFWKNFYWICIFIIYGGSLFIGYQYKFWRGANVAYSNIFDGWIEFVEKYDLCWIGLCGIIFSSSWLIREKVLQVIDK